MLTTLRRIVSGGAMNFGRSGLVSFATVLIMTATLVIIGTLLFLSAILSNTLAAIEDKVDINVYFTTTAAESDILSVQADLKKRPDVSSVSYTSRDQALADFRTRHADDQLTLQALDQLGENPLGASLAIKAIDPTKYAGIVNFLSDGSNISGGSSIIERINYYQNKTVIDRLTAAIQATEKAGIAIVILFALASVIITFATIRLAIYSARDEIAVMRLVGASNMYIRGPFIVAGIIAGIVSALISLALFYPASYYAGKSLSQWLGGFNLFSYYTSHFAYLFLVLVGSGILLGGIASFVAVRRYLRI
ncbi:MAG: Cell division protein FtsX [Parcubacteria group bacterium]|nr:Cell division protein FtsX [Parcubacteria group bacterium]